MPQTLLKSPCIRARCSRLNRSPMMVTVMGKTAPAPRPWMARKIINAIMLGAAPDVIDPSRNRPMPVKRIILRP
jgi:hypothetical protein